MLFIAVSAIVVTAFLCLLTLKGVDLLMFDRGRIVSGEYWRIITGHFVHLGPIHLFLNDFVGLFVLMYARQVNKWLIVFKDITILCTLNGLFLFIIKIDWYMGLSGLLYAMLIYVSLISIKKINSFEMLVIVFISLKVMSEILYGASSLLELFIGAPVLIESHIGGILTGTMYAFFNYVMNRSISSEPRKVGEEGLNKFKKLKG